MKARIKSTKEVIEVISWSSTGKYVKIIGQDGKEEERPINYYTDLDFFDSIDWEQRRYEIASRILPVFASSMQVRMLSVVEDSVAFADALIEELKKPNP